MVRYGLILLASSILSAQFFDFAVTDDGRLYFDTALVTGDEDTRAKVYKLTGNELSLVATGGDTIDPFGPGAIFPFTSGDGSISGYAINYPCRTGSCGISGLPRTFFQIQGVEIAEGFVNNLQVSRNGKYLLGGTFGTGVRLVELPSKESRRIPDGTFPAGAQAVTDTGALLLRGSPASAPLQYLALGGEMCPIPGTEGAASGLINARGDRLLFERTSEAGYQLILTDPQGSSIQILATVPRDLDLGWPLGRFRYVPSFSNDGAVLFLQPASDGSIQPHLADGGQTRLLTRIEGGAQGGILSGNGQIAWIQSGIGQLLRIRTADGAIEEAIGETPSAAPNAQFGVPGSVIRLSGRGVTERSRIQLGDLPLPVAERGVNQIAVQIPWEYDVFNGSRVLTVRGPSSPFGQRFSFEALARPTVTFERAYDTGLLQAAHQDFRGVISSADPARPGETIHVFARNLGPVDRPVKTGERSPGNPVARIVTPFACYLLDMDAGITAPPRAEGARIPFAGLTAGSIGIYQIDITIPESWKAISTGLRCVMDSGGPFLASDSAKIDVAH